MTLQQYATILFEAGQVAFSLAFFLLGFIAMVTVIYGGIAVFRWVSRGGLIAAIRESIPMMDTRSGVMGMTDEESWQVDRQMEREERR